MNNLEKNLIAITLGIWVIAFGYFQEWRQGLEPGLLVVNRVLAQAEAPKMGQDEALEKKTVEYSFENSESLILPETDETYIKRKIEEVFGDKAEEAKLICGCESRYNPTTWGDTNTAYKSVGLFQVRELPKRMEMYNLTTEKLENIDENIRMAKIIYDRSGWFAWRNCANKYNLISK